MKKFIYKVCIFSLFFSSLTVSAVTETPFLGWLKSHLLDLKNSKAIKLIPKSDSVVFIRILCSLTCSEKWINSGFAPEAKEKVIHKTKDEFKQALKEAKATGRVSNSFCLNKKGKPDTFYKITFNTPHGLSIDNSQSVGLCNFTEAFNNDADSKKIGFYFDAENKKWTVKSIAHDIE